MTSEIATLAEPKASSGRRGGIKVEATSVGQTAAHVTPARSMSDRPERSCGCPAQDERAP